MVSKLQTIAMAIQGKGHKTDQWYRTKGKQRVIEDIQRAKEQIKAGEKEPPKKEEKETKKKKKRNLRTELGVMQAKRAGIDISHMK